MDLHVSFQKQKRDFNPPPPFDITSRGSAYITLYDGP